MRFYRPLAPVAALTFDLDDTLYDNQPVIDRTLEESLAFVRHYHPALSQFDDRQLQQWRQQLLQSEPEIYHDVTQWRHRALELAMRNAGLSATQAALGATAAMAHFASWRSRIAVPPATHQTLAALAKKWPLAAITNGNAQPEKCGLAGYFQFVLRAGPDGRSKPFGDMFYLAAQRLGVPRNQILHVGDDLTTDVAGAIRNGLQACWIKPHGADLCHAPDSRLLPHCEISQLSSLIRMLE